MKGAEEKLIDPINNLEEMTDIERVLLIEKGLVTEEKIKNLGIDKERVLYKYSIDQLDHPKTYEQIEQKLAEGIVHKVIINGSLYQEILIKIAKLAEKHKIPYTIKSDPDFKGEVGLELIKLEDE